jgi:hypothetical protein
LEYIIYEKGFIAKGGTPKVAFCGFKKMHPHDDHSIIRVSYIEREAEKSWLKNDLKEACIEASVIFKYIYTKF